MCCEECPKYERCETSDNLKDDCCPKCPDYYDCAGADERKEDSPTDSLVDDDNKNEDYS